MARLMGAPLLRIISSRAPYRRAGLTFDVPAGRSLAVVTVALGSIAGVQFAELLADQHLDVMVGDGATWLSLTDAAGDVDRLVAQAEGGMPLSARERDLEANVTRLEEVTRVLAEREARVAEREAALQAREDGIAEAAMALGETELRLADERLALETSRPDDDAQPGAMPPVPVATTPKPKRPKPPTTT